MREKVRAAPTVIYAEAELAEALAALERLRGKTDA